MRHAKQPQTRGEATGGLFLFDTGRELLAISRNILAAVSHTVVVSAHSADFARGQSRDLPAANLDGGKKRRDGSSRGCIGGGHCLDGLGFLRSDEGIGHQSLGTVPRLLGTSPKTPDQNGAASSATEEKLQAEVTTEIAETAPGKPEASRRTIGPAPPKTTKESGSLRSSLSEMFQGVVGRFTTVAFNAAEILVVLVTVFFGVTFSLMNPRPIFKAIFSLIPERHHDQTLVIVQRIGEFVTGWVGATLLSMVTIGLLVFLIMWPIFGFTDALILGLIACVLEAVPYMGPLLSACPHCCSPSAKAV